MAKYDGLSPEEIRALRDREVMRSKLYEKLAAVRKFKHRFSANGYARAEKDALEKIAEFEKKYPSQD